MLALCVFDAADCSAKAGSALRRGQGDEEWILAHFTIFRQQQTQTQVEMKKGIYICA